MINFTELVDKVDQRNRQNKEAAMAQIQPFFDVMYKKAVYDREQYQQAEQAVAYGQEMGRILNMSFSPMMMGDKYAPANLQFKSMDAQFEAGKVRETIGQFMKDNKDWISEGVAIPEGSVYAQAQWLKGLQEDVSSEKEASKRIKDIVAIHPSIKEALESEEYEDMPSREKYAVAHSMASNIEAESQARTKAEAEAVASSRRIREHQVKTDYTQKIKDEAEASKLAKETALTKKEKRAQNIIEEYKTGRDIGTGYRVKVVKGESGTLKAYTDSGGDRVAYMSGKYYIKNKNTGKFKVAKLKNGEIKGHAEVKGALDKAIKEYSTYEPQVTTGTAVKQDESSGSESNMEVNAWLESIGAKQ